MVSKTDYTVYVYCIPYMTCLRNGGIYHVKQRRQKKIAFWATVLMYVGIAVSLAAGLYMIVRGVQFNSVRFS